ncbi:putative uncharacterized protein [Parachlamydia acanthamoebae UV-7]|jgi:hypothetical protein|uniref:F-box domain-containing protein n=4 Tax=Parachlamydia acanthamoebae TaxID=83552 RepID=F8KV42_PARAV|nr:F-box protein [Parachlamydia acanthamoebae]CCB85119.1 putative uncharacterized protein [Parachlamydia acanthamoebae UV-7]
MTIELNPLQNNLVINIETILPNETLLHLFTFLKEIKTTRLVNKKWRELSLTAEFYEIKKFISFISDKVNKKKYPNESDQINELNKKMLFNYFQNIFVLERALINILKNFEQTDLDQLKLFIEDRDPIDLSFACLSTSLFDLISLHKDLEQLLLDAERQNAIVKNERCQKLYEAFKKANRLSEAAQLIQIATDPVERTMGSTKNIYPRSSIASEIFCDLMQKGNLEIAKIFLKKFYMQNPPQFLCRDYHVNTYLEEKFDMFIKNGDLKNALNLTKIIYEIETERKTFSYIYIKFFRKIVTSYTESNQLEKAKKLIKDYHLGIELL